MHNIQSNTCFRIFDPIFDYLSSLLLQTELYPVSAVVVDSQIFLHSQNITVSMEVLFAEAAALHCCLFL